MILIADTLFAYYKTQAQKEKFQREIVQVTAILVVKLFNLNMIGGLYVSILLNLKSSSMKRRYYSWTIILGIVSILLLSCQDKTTNLRGYVIDPLKDSIEAANIESIKEIYMLLDEQNLEACKEMYSDSAKGYMGSSEESFTFEEIIPYIQMYYTAFPDYQHHIENIFAADDYVVAQLKYTGTHTSKFMEIDSTGNKIEYKGIFVFKLVDGKITEQWGIEDDLTMMSQLGLELK